MKATELKLNLDYYLGGKRWRLTTKGQGHGWVHTLREVDMETGEFYQDKTTGQYRERNASSRDIQETWADFLVRYPDHVKNQKEMERQREVRQEEMRLAAEFSESLRQRVEESAILFNALGFETEVQQLPVYQGGGYVIQITNPMENQQFLRDLVAKKWGM